MSTHHDRSAPDPTVTPEPADQLAATSLEALAEAREADRERHKIDRAMQRHLSPAALELYRQLVDAIDESRGAWNDVHVAELARHLPGFGPTIRLVWAHVIDERIERIGSCCTTGPVEP